MYMVDGSYVLFCKFSLPESHPTESDRALMRARVNHMKICCNRDRGVSILLKTFTADMHYKPLVLKDI